MKLKLLWHEPSNTLAVVDMDFPLPLMTILEPDYKFINPVCTYPMDMLCVTGWIEIGEL